MRIGRLCAPLNLRLVHIGEGFLLLIGLCLVSEPAFAYVDPNSSSVLFQLLAPLTTTVAAGFVFLRRWLMSRLQALFSRRVVSRKQYGERDG